MTGYLAGRAPLSRRTFLRGAGGLALSLPFLEAMLPSMATANTTPARRFVMSFCGTCCGSDSMSKPGAYGALPTTMPRAWKALESVRQHVSVISNTKIPTYLNSQPVPTNASAVIQQHGTTPAPMLAGVSSKDTLPVMVRAQTADQFVADAIGQSTLYDSLQFRVQAIPYSGGRIDKDAKGIMSARGAKDSANALRPMVSPLEIYEKLFLAGSAVTPSPMPSASNPLLRRASVLDLITEDAQRLQSRVSGADRVRLEQHFEEIRAVELRLERQAQMMGGGGGGGTTGGGCGMFSSPGADPAIGTNGFGGWSDETMRGEVMADMIALALVCDMTRVVSWMLSFDQVFMENQTSESFAVPDMHEAAHKQTNGTTNAQDVARAVTADNTNWHAALFARLVEKLSLHDEGGSTALDNTFLALLFAEGPTAHSRVNMRHLVAGSGDRIKLGQHIDGSNEHPGKILISGMQAVGMNQDTLNELSGSFSPIDR